VTLILLSSPSASRAAERASAWARHKEEEQARLAAEAAEKEVEGCTFAPVINPVSKQLSRGRRSVSAARAGRAPSRSGVGRSAIGPPALPGDGGLSAPPSASSSSVHERLYHATTEARERAQAQQRDVLYAYDEAEDGAEVTAAGGRAYGNVGVGSGMGLVDAAASARTPGSGFAARQRSHSAGPTSRRGREMGRPLFGSPSSGSPRFAPGSDPRLRLQRGEPWGGGGAVGGASESAALRPDDLRECTFKPRINPTYDARPVKSR
jgi:hypothetical protein